MTGPTTGSKTRLGPSARIGDYVVEHELPAAPGFVAFSATHMLLPRRARLVSLHPAFTGSQSLAKLLLREACLLEALRHPGVPRVYECGLDAGRRPWIAMELIDGPTFADALVAGPRTVPEMLAMLAEVAEILHHAHARGVVHGNLRPGALKIRREGACIVDWADARSHDTVAAHDRAPTVSSVPTSGDAEPWSVGEAFVYQPPEVLAGGVPDRRSDIYALGAVAYEALAGAPPELPAADRFPGAPRSLTALLDRMLAEDPLARPTSAEVRAEALAVVDHIDVPVSGDVYEDGVEVQVEDVELDVDVDVEIELDSEPASLPQRDVRLRWTPDIYQHQRMQTEKMPVLSSGPDVLLSRTKTDPDLVLFDPSGRKI